MNKLKTLLAALIVFVLIFSCVGQSFAVSAKDTDSLTVVDLVRLKKHIAGIGEYDSEFDYNNDKMVDSRDLIVLRSLIMNGAGNSSTPDNSGDDSKFDEDGYYNQVTKP